MSTRSISSDTSSQVEQFMLARFKSMTVMERAQVAQELNDMCTTLAIAGIRAQNGNVADEDLRWNLAFRRYGRALADEVYGTRQSQ